MTNQLLAKGTKAQDRAEFRRIVMEYRKTHSINVTAAYFSVSRTFVCKWQNRYRLDSSDIRERSRRPQNCARAYAENEKVAFKASLLMDNKAIRKRNRIAPSIYQNMTVFFHRSYSSLKRLANLLIGRCKRLITPKSKKKVRTGRINATASKPGEIVQVDMKCVPKNAIMQTCESEEARKKKLVRAARHHMKRKMNRLKEQARTYPGLPIIKYQQDECYREYKDYVESVQNSTLGPEKTLNLYQYTAVDVKSRWTFRCMYNKHSELASLRFVVELLKAAPFDIQCIQTDNGSEFVSDYLDGHESHITCFQEFLAKHNIVHRRIAKGKPWENAYVEAQHRIDQERLYDAMRVGSLEEGITSLTVYQDESNWYPKPCLGMKSPMDMIGETV